MSATDDMRSAIMERDRIAFELEAAEKAVEALLPAFGRERGYMFKPTVQAVRQELGL